MPKRAQSATRPATSCSCAWNRDLTSLTHRDGPGVHSLCAIKCQERTLSISAIRDLLLAESGLHRLIQSLRAFRRAALCGKVGVLKCWLTGWVVLSGLIGAWFLYVIRWFNFPLGSPLGTHFWELWVVLLVVIFVYWHLAARVFFLAALGVPSSPL